MFGAFLGFCGIKGHLFACAHYLVVTHLLAMSCMSSFEDGDPFVCGLHCPCCGFAPCVHTFHHRAFAVVVSLLHRTLLLGLWLELLDAMLSQLDNDLALGAL